MSPVRMGIGLLILAAGLVIATYPFVSVARVSGEVLGELPAVPGAEADDHLYRFGALHDERFILATRTYRGVAEEDVVQALRGAGFWPAGDGLLARECCGDYDAVLVAIGAGEGGAVVTELTAADGDVQAAWPIITVFGLLVAAAGAGTAFVRGPIAGERPLAEVGS